ncbi:MAG: serine/threonine protein phosphatase [Desulfovibrio sp.]|nr:serine/threonine protein phosphatase [Desulfovibrio sp.]|tara:strand:+ start:1385 stop:3043 length:1659 start_codon:yes stop_codon:yes gene_type:complete
MPTNEQPSYEALLAEIARLRSDRDKQAQDLHDFKQQARQGAAECLNEVEQLRQARETMGLANLIVENSPAILFRREATEEAKLVYVSDNIRQWGYTPEQFISQELSFADIVEKDDQERLSQEIDDYRDKDAGGYAQEYRIRTADGDVRWISDETSVLRDEEGNRLYNQGVLMDITDRKKADQALAASEFKFRRIIETAGEGYFLLNDEMRIVEVNEAYCRMTGYTAEELLGKNPMDLATPAYRRFLLSNMDSLLKKDYRRFEGSIHHKDGHVIPILVNANTLRDRDGNVLGNVAFIADITEQKKAVMLAGEVQKSLLPDTPPRIPGLDMAGASLASEIAGGDYFDYLEGSDREQPSVAVAVGDISGHGVDAALLMTTARAFLRMRAAQPGTPAQIVTEMNRHLSDDLDGSGRFMTLFYLKLDPSENLAHWVRAGHDPAMIYCPVHDAFTELGGEETGLPLGVTRESQYSEEMNELHPGQIIAIGTDGIWETRNPDGEMFGKNRFKAIVRKHAHGTAQDILDAVFEAVQLYSGFARPDDDITLVVIKYGFESL